MLVLYNLNNKLIFEFCGWSAVHFPILKHKKKINLCFQLTIFSDITLFTNYNLFEIRI